MPVVLLFVFFASQLNAEFNNIHVVKYSHFDVQNSKIQMPRSTFEVPLSSSLSRLYKTFSPFVSESNTPAFRFLGKHLSEPMLLVSISGIANCDGVESIYSYSNKTTIKYFFRMSRYQTADHFDDSQIFILLPCKRGHTVDIQLQYTKEVDHIGLFPRK